MTASQAGDRDLAALRAALDACNRRLVAALDERAALVREVARWKRAHGLPPLDPEREQRMLTEVRALALPSGFGAEPTLRVFAAILAESRAVVLQEHADDPPAS